MFEGYHRRKRRSHARRSRRGFGRAGGGHRSKFAAAARACAGRRKGAFKACMRAKLKKHRR